MSHIFDLKISVFGQQFFSRWKSFFLQKQMWAENFEACDTQPVKYLVFPYLLFQKCHCFAFFFLMYWLMLQVSSPKSSSWIACTASLVVCFALSIFSMSLTRHSYWSLILSGWPAKPLFCKANLCLSYQKSKTYKTFHNCFHFSQIFCVIQGSI